MGLFGNIYGYLSGDPNYWEKPDDKANKDPANDPALSAAVQKDVAEKKAAVQNKKGVKRCPNGPHKKKPVDPANNPNDKRCNFAAIKISKADRKYELIVDKTTPKDKRKLAIIAGFKNEPADVTIELMDFFGPCKGKHDQRKTFNTGSLTPKKLPGTNDHKLRLAVTSGTKIKIFPWGLTPLSLPVSAVRCAHPKESATINVYPDTEVEVGLSWDFGERTSRTDTKTEIETERFKSKTKNKTKRKATTTTEVEENVEWSSGLSIEGSISYDGTEREIELAFKSTIETINKVDKIVKKAHKAISSIKKDKAAAEFTQVFDNPLSFGMQLPVVKLGVEGKWEEDEGKPTVSYKGKIKIEGDPLFGLKFEYNITDTVLMASPGGLAIKKILQKLEAGVLELVVSAGAEVNGSVEIDIANYEIENVTGKLGGKIPITAELTAIKAEANVWFAHASIEYKIGVESGFFTEISFDKESQAFKCVAGMLDFVIWYSGGMEFGLAEDDNEENTLGEKDKGAESSQSQEPESGIEMEGKTELYKIEFEEDAKEIFTYNFKQI